MCRKISRKISKHPGRSSIAVKILHESNPRAGIAISALFQPTRVLSRALANDCCFPISRNRLRKREGEGEKKRYAKHVVMSAFSRIANLFIYFQIAYKTNPEILFPARCNFIASFCLRITKLGLFRVIDLFILDVLWILNFYDRKLAIVRDITRRILRNNREIFSRI